jgi:predicted MPP superfamily phosphohydrolase
MPVKGIGLRVEFLSMIFLSAFFSLTAIAHFSLYRFLLRWFGINHPAAKATLLAAFAFLAVSFMAAFFLLRWVEAPWTIHFYRFAAVWLALAVKLVLAVAAAWVLYGGLRVFGAPESAFRFVASACVLLALAWSAYGFWTAFHPVLTHVDVTLEKLPDRWRNRTIVQLSDLHLGHFHSPAAIQGLVKRVNALSPDLVVITGDLFDGMADGRPEFVEPLRNLSSRLGVFFVTGNHEVYAGLRRCLDLVEKAGIRVLFNEVAEVDGLNLMGIAYPGIKDRSEIQGLDHALGPSAEQRPLILLFHTPTDIRRDGTQDRRTATYWRPDTSFALSRELGVSLQLSGHTHKGQLFPFGCLTHWIYNGYDYGLHSLGGFSLFTSSGVGTWGPPMRTGAAPEIVVITLK